MSTCLRLSYYLDFPASKRITYVSEAEKFGKHALENAVKSQNDGRVAQMQFYLACVKAREIQLRMDSEGLTRTTVQIPEREVALTSLRGALVYLRTIGTMDMSVYEAMADEYLPYLGDGGPAQVAG